MGSGMELPGPDTLQDIDHWVLLVNPKSSGAVRTRDQIRALQRSSLGRSVEPITPQSGKEDPASMQKRALARLRLGSGLIVLGGDGSYSHAVNGVMHSPHLAGRRIPLLAGAAGNGNDIARTHMYRSDLSSIEAMLERGRITPIHPIETRFAIHGARYDRFAVAYFGLGATARGAELFDSEIHRTKLLYTQRLARLALESVLATRAMVGQEYELDFGKGTEMVSELSVANYPREAKVGKWPIRADERELYVNQENPRTAIGAAVWAGRFVAGNIPGLAPKGRFLHPDEESLSFTTLSASTPIHWDAEPSALPAKTLVNIASYPIPFYAVTTKL